MDEFKELEEIHSQALKFVAEHFPEVKKYARDYRATIITVMRFLIDLKKLKKE